ncbi:MAG TPA: transglutaminase domain-containing protein, partial [Gemmataceae bacterium]|nr:transglutaminase domain-containing protein [Gemmataceae bacterium]
LVAALTKSPEEQRKGMAFLIANMPDRDLQWIHADFLLEDADLAYKARKETAWGPKIPEDLFLNNILAYANVDESRDAWRKDMYDLCMPIVKDCKTPTEAAMKLNATVFGTLKVRYSTQRKKANQSPKESIEQGLASCTGLSIILSDACRSVAVPTRIAGTPLWSNNSGNHTWVEIWDDGWHFTGACEPDPTGLDRGWFVKNASEAKKDVPEHAIYAASFRKTDVSFPLVWARNRKDVYAENVTERYAAKGDKAALEKEQAEQIGKEAAAYFKASDEERAKLQFDPHLDALLAANEPAVRAAVWKAYKESAVSDAVKKDFEANQVRWKDYLSAYVVREVGKKPDGGWPLVVAMHGGGGAPKELNDSQWKMMQIYYKDHPEVSGYKYLALRAPNDTWNGFYDDYVPPLVINLIRQFTLLGDVDPDKVFLIGYSHGGYGAFFIGPKIPDRFAAIHSSAAAATDGTISPYSLRNTRFTFMVGSEDNAYGRRERCEKFNDQIEKLKKDSPDDFPVVFEEEKGFGHGGLPDRDYLKEMLPFTRSAVPRHLTWEPMDSHITDFFWLTVPKPEKGQSIDVVLRDSTAKITTQKVKEFDLDLDGRLATLDKPLRIVLDGKESDVTLHPQLLTLCQSLLERGDPQLAFTCRVHLAAANAGGDAPAPAKDEDALKKLQQAKLEAAQKLVQLRTAEYQAGKIALDPLFAAEKELATTELDMQDKKEDRVALCQKIVDRAQEIKQIAEKRLDAGLGSPADVLQAEYELLDAQIHLEREKRK